MGSFWRSGLCVGVVALALLPAWSASLDSSTGVPLGGAVPSAADADAPIALEESSEARVPALPDGVHLSLRVDPTELSIGDLLTARVIVEAPSGWVVEMPHGIAQLKEFEVRSFSASEPQKLRKGKTRSEWIYELALFGTGNFLLPPLWVTLADTAAGAGWALATDPLLLTVVSRGLDSTADIESDDLPLRRSGSVPPVVGLIAVAVAALIAAVVLWRRRVNASCEPPHTQALREIEKLLATGDGDAEEQSRHNLFALKLGLTLRGYLDRRFELETLEKTTGELLVLLADSPRELEPWRKAIAEFCRRTDRVKFGGDRLEPGEAAHLAGEVRKLIAATLPKEEELKGKAAR